MVKMLKMVKKLNLGFSFLTILSTSYISLKKMKILSIFGINILKSSFTNQYRTDLTKLM